MFVSSLIESPVAKTRMWQKAQDPVKKHRAGQFARCLVWVGTAFWVAGTST